MNTRKENESKEVEAYIVQRYIQYPLLIGGAVTKIIQNVIKIL